jgi:hypothetical protein
LTLAELAARSPGSRQALAEILSQEIDAGRVRFDGGRFVLVHERFEPDVLAALADIG